jgi:hypothetical protein
VSALSAAKEVPAIVAARVEGWPEPVDRAWHRLLGRALDRHGIPGVLDGEPAATWLLRGGERERARRSLARHLLHHPADPVAWRVAVTFEGLPAAARCAFHGGPVLPELDPVAEPLEEDEQEDIAAWGLAYAWLLGQVGTPLLAEAVSAARLERPLPIAGDGRGFTYLLVETEHEGPGPPSPQVVEARRRLRVISPRAFQRYLDRK